MSTELPDAEIERVISEHRTFYNKYFRGFNKRAQALRAIYPLTLRFQEKKPRTLLVVDPEADAMVKEAESILEKYFDKEILSLFKKEVPKVNSHRNFKDEVNNSFWLALFAHFYTSMEELKEQHKSDWNYKTNFLIFTNDCLTNYGLHKNILLRDASLFKRFNLRIEHYHRSRKPLISWKAYLSHKEFGDQFTRHYLKQKPISIQGLLIPFDKIHQVKITTTLLLEEELPLFAEKNNFSWSNESKDTLAFIDCCIDETEKYHPNPFDENTYDNKVNLWVVAEVDNLLLNYPSSHKLYLSAMTKFRDSKFERNILDDLRLCLEKLLQEFFKNSKPLEKQIQEVGHFQKKKGISSELTNMFQKLLDYYSKYQNNYVKHDDNVKSNEIEFVIDLTSSFLKFIIKR